MNIDYCRLCFESEAFESPLIAPCRCKGSSLYVHMHCLKRWQSVSIENNNLMKAIRCQICGSPYTYPFWINTCVCSLTNFFILKLTASWRPAFDLLLTFLNAVAYAFLLMVTLPWGGVSLGKYMSISWLGYQFPPQLALTYSNSADSGIDSQLSDGAILVASEAIPTASVFHKSVIILLEYSENGECRGVILNKRRESLLATRDGVTDSVRIDFRQRTLDGYEIGYGGPLARSRITVIHDCDDTSLVSESDFMCPSESIFVSEYPRKNASAVSSAGARNRLIRLFRAAALKAKNHLYSAATRYAHRMLSRVRSYQRRGHTNSSTSTNTSTNIAPAALPRGNARITSNTPAAAERRRRRPSELELQLYIDATYASYRSLSPTRGEEPAEPNSSGSSQPTGNIKIVQGLVQWSKSQLRGEIAAGFWRVLPLRHSYVFSSSQMTFLPQSSLLSPSAGDSDETEVEVEVEVDEERQWENLSKACDAGAAEETAHLTRSSRCGNLEIAECPSILQAIGLLIDAVIS